jgi:hypothetical protein
VLKTNVNRTIHGFLEFLDRIHRAELLLRYIPHPLNNQTDPSRDTRWDLVDLTVDPYDILSHTPHSQSPPSSSTEGPNRSMDGDHGRRGSTTDIRSTFSAFWSKLFRRRGGRKKKKRPSLGEILFPPPTRHERASRSVMGAGSGGVSPSAPPECSPPRFMYASWAPPPDRPSSAIGGEDDGMVVVDVSGCGTEGRGVYERSSVLPTQPIQITPRLARRFLTRQVSLPPPYDEIAKRVELLNALSGDNVYAISEAGIIDGQSGSGRQEQASSLLHLPR